MEITCNWDMTNVTDYFSGPHRCIYLDDCRVSAILYMIISCIAVLVCSMAFIGIMLVQKKEGVMFLLLSLTTADLICPIFQIITVASDPRCDRTYRTQWEGESAGVGAAVFGQISYAMQITAFYAVLLTSFIMAVDRLIATTKPFQHRRIVTKRRVVSTLVIGWVVSFLLGFLAYFVALLPQEEVDTESVSNSTGFVNETMTVGSDSSVDGTLIYLSKVRGAFSLALTILFGVACFVFVSLVVVYSIIFREIRNHQKFASVSTQQKTSIIKGVVTSLLIVGSFAVCWLPYSITYIVNLYHSSVHEGVMSPGKYSLILGWRNANFALVLLNSVIDPFIYVTRNVKIKNAIWNRVENVKCLSSCRRLLRKDSTGSRGTELTNSSSQNSSRGTKLSNVERPQ